MNNYVLKQVHWNKNLRKHRTHAAILSPTIIKGFDIRMIYIYDDVSYTVLFRVIRTFDVELVHPA